MTTSDFGADIFDPGDNKPSPPSKDDGGAESKPTRRKSPKKAAAEVDADAPQDAAEAKPARKKAAKKKTAKKKVAKKKTAAKKATTKKATKKRSTKKAAAAPSEAESDALEIVPPTIAEAVELPTETERPPEAEARDAEAQPDEAPRKRRSRRRRSADRSEDEPRESQVEERDESERDAEAGEERRGRHSRRRHGPDRAEDETRDRQVEDRQVEDRDEPGRGEPERGEDDRGEDQGEGRRGRRSRRRRGADRSDEPREPQRDEDGSRRDDEYGEERRGRRSRRGRGRRPEPIEGQRRPGLPAPSLDADIHGQRIAVLIDFEALREQADQRDAELAYGRLLRHLSRRRHLIRAIAYGPESRFEAVASTLQGSGLDARPVGPGSLQLELAVDAMSMADRIDSLIVLPDGPELDPLERGLAGHGVRLETASFSREDRSRARPHLELGEESLFQP